MSGGRVWWTGGDGLDTDVKGAARTEGYTILCDQYTDEKKKHTFPLDNHAQVLLIEKPNMRDGVAEAQLITMILISRAKQRITSTRA